MKKIIIERNDANKDAIDFVFELKTITLFLTDQNENDETSFNEVFDYIIAQISNNEDVKTELGNSIRKEDQDRLDELSSLICETINKEIKEIRKAIDQNK